ncbi:MAG: di-heme-cytochrome C peroxidase [Alphaproteobacteria bacterium]
MLRTVLSVSTLVFASWATVSERARAADCDGGDYDGAYAGDVLLPQNWNCAERQAFWFTDQGSEIIPYSWFLHLEQADSSEKFIDPGHIDRLRYLPQRPTAANPDALPIGFTKGSAAADSANGAISGTWLGMNCAACHTGQIAYDGKTYLIDGGPTMGDFEALFARLVDAMRATLLSDEKFARFAKAVIDTSKTVGDGGTTDEAELREQLELMTARREAWNQRNRGSSPYGHGRLDAVGSIFNEVVAAGLKTPGNAQPADAPVSYPFIWDTPQHDYVEWNGAVRNLGLGALSRNVGEVIGVFAELEVNTDPSRPTGHKSSIDMNGLATLEEQLWTLWSPLWADTDLPLDKALADKGREDYETYCARCHRHIERDDPARRVDAVLMPVFNPKRPTDPNALRTDPAMAEAFRWRTASAVKLTGLPVAYLEALSHGSTFEKAGEDATPAAAVLGYAITGTIVDGLIRDPKGTVRALKVGQPPALQNAIDQAAQALVKEPGEVGFKAFLEGLGAGLDQLPADDHPCPPARVNPIVCYKARPLNGIWATAPYLHNGSVRTLRQLLLPSDQRETLFRTGSRAFDPVDVGFVSEGATTLDTSLPGNTNGGHDGPIYGNDVFADDPERLEAILEYLKTL